MKTIKITTNANCQGRYDEVVLVVGNVKTAIVFKRLVSQAQTEFARFKKLSPNYSMFIMVNDEKIADRDADLLFAAASNDKELADNAAIERFLNQ